MARKTIDPGIGTTFRRRSSRMIDGDGSFNINRKGVPITAISLYQELIKMSWKKFMLLTLTTLLLINVFFASIYLAIGIKHLGGVVPSTFLNNFLSALYFSFQTITTVGYGYYHPLGNAANIVASLEAILGLIIFALSTGLLYGRFSRPSARILFSRNLLIAPYREGWGLMFRIANARSSQMMNLKATVIFNLITDLDNHVERSYYTLELERNTVTLFPLTWTLVHPINEKSPLWNFDFEDRKTEFELMIILEGFDETHGQIVFSRYSYQQLDLVQGARFIRNFDTNEENEVELHLDQLNNYEKVAYSGFKKKIDA